MEESKMKKLLILALAGTLALSLAACKKTETIDVASEEIPAIASEIVADVTSEVTDAVDDAVDDVIDYPDFTGTFTEPMSGRCVINIEHTEGDDHQVTIHWSSSAAESANWEMTATYYPSTGLLEYTNAKYFVRTYTDDTNFTDDVKYEDGDGCFWFEEDGTLGWKSGKSDVDGVDGSTFFERIPAEVEAE